MSHRILMNRPSALVMDADSYLRGLRRGPASYALALMMLLCCALPAMAADFDLSGVDMKRCSYWDITLLDANPTGLKTDNAEHLAHPLWMILAAHNMARRGDDYVDAPCLFDGDILIRCEGKLPFPMAGAVYQNLVKPHQDPVYQCIRGCDRPGVLQYVFDLTGEGVHPSRWHFADQIDAYHKRCAGRLDSNGFLKEAKKTAP